MTFNKITNKFNQKKVEDFIKGECVEENESRKEQTYVVDEIVHVQFNPNDENTDKGKVNTIVNKKENKNEQTSNKNQVPFKKEQELKKEKEEELKELEKWKNINNTNHHNTNKNKNNKNKYTNNNSNNNRNNVNSSNNTSNSNSNDNNESNINYNKGTSSRGEKKKNKKVMDLSYIIHYNRYQPIKREMPKRKSVNTFVKKNINQYINCNFRYYVSDKEYLMSNIIGENVNWDKIEKVDYIVPQETTLSCPICLENNFISPRITKCRHIFCFFCILKYFSQEEKKTWKKCPICFEMIIESDLRIVKFQYVKNYNINDSISLCLLYTDNKKVHLKSNNLNFNNNFKITNNTFLGKGEKETNEKYELDLGYMNKNLIHLSKVHTKKIGKLNLNLGVQFFKLFYIYNPLAMWLKDLFICNVLLNQKQINAFVSEENVINEARERIQCKICNYLNIPVDKFQSKLYIEDESSDSFYIYDNMAHSVYESIEKIKQEMECYREMDASKKMLKEEQKLKRETKEDKDTEKKEKYNKETEKEKDKEKEKEKEKEENEKKRGEQNDHEKTNPLGPNVLKDWNQIYFYQCIEGQYIYLDPFILKLLLYEYNYDVNELPKFLYNKKITYIKSFELDDKMRKKHFILSHLPLGVHVLFISIHIDDIISERTKEHFSKEISFVQTKHSNFLKRKKHEEKHFDLLAMQTIQRKEQHYWNLANNKIVIKKNTNEEYSKPKEDRGLLFSERGDSYIYDICGKEKAFNCDKILIEGEVIDEIPPHETWSNKIDRSERKDKELTKKKRKKKTGKLPKIEKEQEHSDKAVDSFSAKDNADTEGVAHKKSFLDIAKATCSIEKKQELKKKEEKFSLGSGILSISLLDLINDQKMRKKKKKGKNNQPSEKAPPQNQKT